MIRDITDDQKDEYNAVVSHPLQSFEWGEFRKKTGITVIRKGLYQEDKLTEAFTITIHPIPHTNWTIGYLPKSNYPSKDMLDALKEIGKEELCIFIQLEPNVVERIYDAKTDEVIKEEKVEKLITHKNIVPSAHPLFTKFTLQLDLTKPEEELLSSMHAKTRYNIRVAQKHGVVVVEQNTDDAFETYWHLMEETTKRQKFYAHTKKYHKLWWETLQAKNEKSKVHNNLEAHLLLAKYQPEDLEKSVDLVSWALFTFHDTLYYPYGASSTQYKNVMAPNLMMWEAIRFGKKHNLKTFDMWGSMGPHPDTSDPWYGFHRFKLGYNPQLVEFIGSYDLIINPIQYQFYKLANKLRWMYLKLRK